MTYTVMNLVFLGIAAVVAVAAAVRERRRRALRGALLAGAGTLVVLVVFTAVFDNVIVGVGLVDYDTQHTLGITIGTAPLEDFAYAVAAVLLLPSLWLLLPMRHRPPRRGDQRMRTDRTDRESAR